MRTTGIAFAVPTAPWLSPKLEHFLDAASRHQLAITATFIAVIFVLFLAWTGWYLWKISRLRGAIGQILARWRGTDKVAFFREFREINEAMQANRFLSHSWEEFRETFVFPANDEDAQVVSNTIDAAEFFNRDTIVASWIDLDFVAKIPNLLTGVGILGTFLGLVLGLYGARNLVTDSNAGIRMLFSGAYLAFLTSLFGLLFSIAFSVLVTRRIHALDGTLHELVRMLDAGVQRLTVESLTRELVSLGRRQVKSLEVFVTDLAVAIGNTIHDNLSSLLLPVLDKISRALSEDVPARIATDIHQAIRTEIVPRLVELAGRTAEIATTTREVSANLDSLGTVIHDNLSSLLLPVLDKISRALSEDVPARIATDIHQAIRTEMAPRFTELDEKVAEIAAMSRKVSGHLDSLGTLIRDDLPVSTAERLSHRLLPALEAIQKTLQRSLAEERGDITEALRKVVEDLGKTLRSSTIEEFQNLARILADVGKQLENTTRKNSQEFEKAAADATAALQQAAAALADKVESATSTASEKLTEAASSAGGAFRDILVEVRSAGERSAAKLEASLSRVVASLESAGTKLRKSLGQMTVGLHTACRTLEEKRVVLEKIVGTLPEVLDRFENAGQTVHDAATSFTSAATMAGEVTKKLDATGDHVQQILTSLEGSLASVRNLSLTLGELHATATRAVEQFQELWRRHEQRFVGLDHALEQVMAQLQGGLDGYRKKVAEFHVQLDDNFDKIARLLAGLIEELSEVCDGIQGKR